MIRVLLADDHPFVRKGIRNILHKTKDIVVVGEAGDGFQALRLVNELEPDVLVLDMEMPGMKGFEVAHQLKNEGAGLPVLALSAHDDKHYILGMLSEGANGYLTRMKRRIRSLRRSGVWLRGNAAGSAGGWPRALQSG
jgi:DNA-binding NarL/FixJ family response regulator